MLQIYKRHGLNCEQKSRRYRRCKCPCWIEGTVEGKYYRQSLKTRSWERAQKLARTIEEGRGGNSRVALEQACETFLNDAKARGLREASIYKYALLFRRLKEFADKEGLRFLSEFDLETLARFRSTWDLKNSSAQNTTTKLKALFQFAHNTKWIEENPAEKLKSPEVTEAPTLPFSAEEIGRIMQAAESYPGKNAALLKAFVLLLRYSGIRIGDAVALTRDRIVDGRLFLYTAKTKTPVRIPLPPECLSALAALPQNGQRFFWSGEGKLKTRVWNFQRMLASLFKTAEIEGGHAHRFRDTFAVELLSNGVPLERVAKLLGHSSTKVTERHYSPWVESRQQQLEDDVRRTWGALATRTNSRTTQNTIANRQ